MTPFRYLWASDAFIDELADKVSDGESCVLLGFHYSGKRYCLEELRKKLIQSCSSPVILRRMQPGADIGSGTDVECTLEKQDAIFEQIDRHWEEKRTPAILLVGNVDSLTHNARRLLQGVQRRVSEHQLIAVLTGEYDFRDLVHGDNSEFRCANQFVIQGRDLVSFRHLLEAHAMGLGLELESPEEICSYLWNQTGGNGLVLKTVLWSIVEAWMRDRPSARKLTRSLIERVTADETFITFWGTRILRDAVRLIAADPRSWRNLELLIHDNPAPLNLPSGTPGALTLSGIAVREEGHLRFASPLMARFVKKHYGDLRLGDLYAREGMWEQAFERYRRLPRAERMRPAHVDDRGEIEGLVRAFGSVLHSEANKSIDRLVVMFSEGCRYLLGFSEVTFWRRAECWEAFRSDGENIRPELTQELRGTLPMGESLNPGFMPLPDRLSKFAVAALLNPRRSDRAAAVVLGDFGNKAPFSKDRLRFSRELLAHFVDAYSHAVTVERNQLRLEIRDRHIEVLQAISESFGTAALNVDQILFMAGQGLRKLGYRRALFCLVDPTRTRIQGVLDSSDDPRIDVARLIDWPLNQPDADLQCLVVELKRYQIVENVRENRFINQEIARRARMNPLAIVPMFNRIGDVIGTIHVERSDGTIPSEEEILDLQAFGRQLAVLIEQSERINLLQSALDKLPAPIAIVDRRDRPRYTNKPAAELLNLELGWLDPSGAKALSGTQELLNYIHESLTGEKVEHTLDGVGSDQGYRGQIRCEKIEDWRGRVVGALVYIQDQNYLYRIFDAFRLAATATDTDSAIDSMLDAAKLLRYKWGRLYRFLETEPDRLVPMKCFDQDQEVQSRFQAGLLELPRRRERTPDVWRSIELRKPLVFCYTTDREDGSEFKNRHGVTMIAVPKPTLAAELKKRPGSCWLDFPIGIRDTPLGKMTLGCEPEVSLVDFEMLVVLWKMVTELLEAFVRRDRAFQEKHDWIRQAAEKSMSETAHNIGTRIAFLSPLMARYCHLEGKLEQLKPLNEDLKNELDGLGAIIRRVNKALTRPQLRRTEFDLKEIINRALREAGLSSTVVCADSCLRVSADAELLETALLELAGNSRKADCNSEKPRVTVSLSAFSRSEGDWIKIVYQDFGPGIHDDKKERVFEDFYTEWSGGEGGTGIGLSSVRNIVRAHGGVICERGIYGKGAEFVIELPRVVQENRIE